MLVYKIRTGSKGVLEYHLFVYVFELKFVLNELADLYQT
jgi:hypothetical protein